MTDENSMSDEEMLSLLQRKFSFSEFRPPQKEVIQTIISGQSCLMIMPTGSGKSLVSQFLAAKDDGLVVVLSPLIALMDDQHGRAMALGIRSVVIHSGIRSGEKQRRMEALKQGEYQIAFVTPERFRQDVFVEALMAHPIAALVVDEAHCMSQWGHDFRPDYSRINEIRARIGNPPTLLQTATLTPQAQADVLKSMGFENNPIFTSGLLRPELSLNVHSVYGDEEKIRSVVGLYYQSQGTMILYVSLISTLYKMKKELERLGLKPLMYHGQMEGKHRRMVLEEFLTDPKAFMIATPAFGLGIDKPDVRCVVHAEIPGSVEAFFQEAGRAGRDGLRASCHILYDRDDVSIHEEFIKWGHPEESVIETVYRLIERRDPDLDHRGYDYLREQINFYNRRDFRAEASVQLLERWGCLSNEPTMRFPFAAANEPTSDDFATAKTQSRLRVQREKLLEIVRFSENTTECRRQMVHKYFGEEISVCGICDNCLSLNVIDKKLQENSQ